MRISRKKVNKVEPIIENNLEVEKPIVEKKIICKIVLAKPNYYVIEKEGKLITFNEKNNYKRGDEDLF